MTIQEDLQISAANISAIGEKISRHQLLLSDFKDYYVQLIKVYNDCIQIYQEYVNHPNNDNELKKRIILCEIKAWQIYTSFKKNFIDRSFKNFLLQCKHSFNKNSEYHIKMGKISEIRKELNDRIIVLDNEEKLKKFRELGTLCDEVYEEKIIKDYNIFWVAVGVIVAIIMIFK